MKVDLSTLLLVVLVVIPGLFAQRARDLIVPRALTPKGATEELAELVALGVATHGVLALLLACVLLVAGMLTGLRPSLYFSKLDAWNVTSWMQVHPAETVLVTTACIFSSFFVGHCLGLAYGALSSKGRLTARLLGQAQWLERFGFYGFLGERPIIYELLNVDRNAQGDVKTMFIEAEMKDGLGFYSGQLSQFAIVRDEEPHRPIYMVEPWYKSSRDEMYSPVQADGILLDLADVACLLIKQIDQIG